MKKLSLVLSLVLFVMGTTLAQRTITGTVTDESGETLIGASILVKGTTTGAVTDIDGTYSITVPEGSNILQFSYTGYATQEVPLSASNAVDVIMVSSAEVFDELVVTGLGIEKEKKALGFGVSTLTNEALTARQETDVARLLRGQATGVDITQTSGLAGSGTNIIIRGFSSITGSNQPLFVVDGVPFNTSQNTGGQGFTSGGASASSRFMDLDPNVIEEISILKGLSATVLYGEAGRNGVVLVTTKNGKAGAGATKGMEVSVTQSVFQSEIANMPDYQDTYGNGFNAGFGWFFSNWGAAFDDLRPSSYGSDYQGERDGRALITHPYDQSRYADAFPEFAGAEYVHQPYESVEEFFTPGLSSNTNVSIQSSLGNNSSISATYSYLTEEGFLPRLDDQRDNERSNFVDKHNFGLGAKTKLANGIGLKGTFNYVNTDRRTPLTSPAFGGSGSGLFAAILFTPRSIDLMNLPYQNPIDGSTVYYRRGSVIENLRWVLNNSAQTENVQRFFSTMEADYEFSDNFRLLYRLGIDSYSQRNQRYQNKGGVAISNGLGILNTTTTSNRITEQLLNGLYNFQITDDLTIDGVVGVNLRRITRDFTGAFSSQQFVYGLINHGNFIDHDSNSFLTEENTLGVFATATLGYKNYLYVNLQARNDWTSTLEQNNNSVLYPSASLSFVPTDAFSGLQNSSVLNYLKLRVGYGTSAGYPDPYSTRSVLDASTRQFITPGGTVLNTNSVANFLGNRNLTRELFEEIEGGVEARFLQNRVGIDLSLYQKTSRDLIINLPLDPATGYTSTTVNAAEVENRGVELGLNITPVIAGDFRWDITLNYTRNVSNVNSIIDGVDQVNIAGYSNLGNYAIPGEQYGMLWGERFLRDENGQIIVNGQGGYNFAPDGVIGDPNPDFQANWINNISWKGLSFGFQWQYIQGGDIYSSTVGALLARGNTTDTDFDRNVPIVLPNGVKADGTPNDIQVYIGDEAFNTFFTAEGAVVDATVLRLRQISLAYALPKSILDKTPFGRMGITVSGENLWFNAPNVPAGINFDPEVASLGVGNGRGFDFRTAPTAAKYGVTINATF